jgi:uncharacterized protein YegP (UPF0339 family)
VLARPDRGGSRQLDEIIAVGEAYESKSAALNGIDSAKRNPAEAAPDDVTG